MKKQIITIFITILSTALWAQEQPKDTLNTEVINVVKPYSPSISDAFKIKDQPNAEDTNVAKETINYQINSVPVASTFTPAKGKAKKVKKPKKERLHDNYISVGFGNYTTPLVEAYLRTYPTRDAEFGVLLKHHSSQGGIKEVLFDDSFYDSNIDLYYKSSTRDMDWKVNLGALHQIYNWYGVLTPEEGGDTFYTEAFLENFDPKQKYMNIALDGEIDYFDSYFKGASSTISLFSDAYDSFEVRARLQPKLELPIASEIISFDFDIDYLNGSYDEIYEPLSSFALPKTYSYFNLGITPNFEVLRDNFRLNLGAKAYYAMDMEQKENTFKFYPNVDISYQVMDDVLAIFAGATGGLNHNTYLEATQENPFLAPNYYSMPTDQKYKAYAGFKGKLASNVNYLFKGFYADEKNKAMYLFNFPRTYTGVIVLDTVQAYALGNSFSTIYDDVKTLGFYGEVAMDLTKAITVGGSADYATYTMNVQEEAWNLPNIKATIFSNYHQDKWTANAKLFVVGSRKDSVKPFISIPLTPSETDDYIVTNNAYLDLNASVAYSFSDRLSAFAKGHNLLTTQYQRYYNYPVQGIQVMAGITYKFDL